MILRHKKLDRRTLIRGMVNGSMITMGLPLLELMLNDNGDALANGQALPKRFVLFFFGCGVSNSFFPSTTGSNFQLTVPMQALAPFASQLNVISNLSVRDQGIDPHAAKYYMQLSGSSPRTERHSYGTLDQYIASKISTNQTYQSVQLRISNSVDSDGIVPQSNVLSYRVPGPGANPVPLPPDIDPSAAFNRIFGNVPDKNEFLSKIYLMNALKEDTKRLMRTVGKNDKYLIEEFYSNVNDLAKIIDDKYNMKCDQLAVDPNQSLDVNNLDERMRVMSAITATMFKCDMTRVVSILHSAPASNQIYPSVAANIHHHELTHREDATRLTAITGIIMGHLAILLGALSEVPEGTGNLLQQTLVYAVTEETFPSHRFTNLPAILIGSAGNSAYKTGHHVNAGGSSPARAALTALRALEIDAGDWPHDDPAITDNRTGHLSELF